ncbi:hypothetical protein C8Q75DRAFT_516529 [Abortiporus biennis]|nr:hypothetical protein C8Q75DRAFT_516529 [Abortiporus biennis]
MQKPPKKPPSAYLLFMNDFWNDRPRAQSIDESRQLMSEGAKLWKTLSADRVAEYQEKADASMKIWREQRTEYARSLPLADFLILNKVRGHQKKRLYRFNDVPQDERPKGKKYNKYSEFVRREFTDLDLPPGMTACDYISKVLMVKWRSLSPSEKDSYKVNSLH